MPASFMTTNAQNCARKTPLTNLIRAPAAPAADQVPQVTTPLLLPPLNQLAQLPAARAHEENAENAQEGRGLRMPDQRRITREIMRGWAPHSDARENGAPQPRAMALHLRHATQTFDCMCCCHCVGERNSVY